MSARPLHLVLPASVDDPATPSGGNGYDRRLRAGLAAAGLPVRSVPVGGSWPHPDAAARGELAAALAAAGDGDPVLLDGLVGCAAPDVLEPHADRLALALLVHLPLADETGLAPDVAADLDARERRALHAARAVIATSAATARRVTARHGLPAARVHVAPPGAEPAPPAVPAPDGGRLACLASLTPRKGHPVLLAALADLADRPWTCVCAGPAPDPAHAGRLRALAAVPALAGRVTFPGPLDADGVAALLAATDLLVLPSLAEPYGMVVTEALARGVPVVASAVDGVPEALGHAPGGTRPGLLVPPGDAAALAAALRTWLEDPQLRARLRAAAADRRAALPGWDATVEAVARVLAPAATGSVR